ncbi:MAG: SRPBCC family protein [Flavobacteriales bacterium]|jgi:effector-binding domain-containing protein|nr:SRPBCC family protein [Flavobacteriales bacterium]
MRALKTILIILLAVAALIVVLGLIGPKTTVVERSTTIAAPVESVYPHVSSLKESFKWSPWKDADKDQVTTFSGPDGEVGSIQEWVGDTVGTGSQEIIELEPNKHVGSTLKFIEPFESQAKVDLDLATEGDGSKVTWKMTSQNNFMARVMNVFMNMDEMIGPEFEKGLTKLKDMSEAEYTAVAAELAAKTFRGYVIETIERPSMTYVGKRAVTKFAEMERFIGTTYGAAGAALGKAQVPMSGSPSALYFSYDDKGMSADMMPAFPVKADQGFSLAGYTTYTTPASKALHIPYMGAYDKVGEAHYAMDEMIKANGLTQHDVVIEEYVTDPMSEPDTSKWLTNIYYLVK